MTGTEPTRDATAPSVRVEHLVPDGAAGRVALLTVSDPRRRNAMTAALSDGLVAALRTAADDPGVHAVVVTGSDEHGPAFCAGGDLDELAAAGGAGPSDPAGGAGPSDPAGEGGEESLHRIYAGFLALAECPLPTIAAVDGAAVGAGLNLALAADVRLAGESARFEPGFLRLGVHPGGGMTWMAQRLVGPQVTTAMLLGGERLDARRAAQLGLVLRVVPDRSADADGPAPDEGPPAWTGSGRSAAVTAALAMAAVSARAPRELVTSTKASIRATGGLTDHADAVAVEVGPQLASLRSEGFGEGLARVRARR